MCKHTDNPPSTDANPQDFGKEAPFQQPKDPRNSWMSRVDKKLDDIEHQLNLLLGAPAPTGDGRSTPTAGCAEPSATPSRNPSSDLGLAKEYRDGGGKELDVYLFRKGLDELFLKWIEVTTPKTPAWTPKEGDKVVSFGPYVDHSNNYKGVGTVTEVLDSDWQVLWPSGTHSFHSGKSTRPATPSEVQQWEREQWTPSVGDLCTVIDYKIPYPHPGNATDWRGVVLRVEEGMIDVPPRQNLKDHKGGKWSLERQFLQKASPHECKLFADREAAWEAEQESKKPLAPGMKVKHKDGRKGVYVDPYEDAVDKRIHCHWLALRGRDRSWTTEFVGRSEFKVLEP